MITLHGEMEMYQGLGPDRRDQRHTLVRQAQHARVVAGSGVDDPRSIEAFLHPVADARRWDVSLTSGARSSEG